MQKDESIRDGDVIDICVSYDGSWHKRGFSSKYGVGTIVEMETGLILDYEALSLYCHVSLYDYIIIVIIYKSIIFLFL